VSEEIETLLSDQMLVDRELEKKEENLVVLNKRLDTAERRARALEAEVIAARNALKSSSSDSKLSDMESKLQGKLNEAIKSEDEVYELEGKLGDKDEELIRAREEYNATIVAHDNLNEKLWREERARGNEEEETRKRGEITELERDDERRFQQRRDYLESFIPCEGEDVLREREKELQDDKATLEEYETEFKEAKRNEKVLQRDIQRKCNKEETLRQRADVLEETISNPNADELILLEGQIKAAEVRAEGAARRRQVVECTLDELQGEITALNKKKERLETEMKEMAMRAEDQ